MTAIVTVAWLLLRQAGIASGKIHALYKEHGINPDDTRERDSFNDDNSDASFYSGKLKAARYFIKNCLPRVDAYSIAIMNADMSVSDIGIDEF